MIGKYAAVAAIGALCIAGQASAKDAAMAQLSAVKGSVMVNQGGDMAAATAGALRVHHNTVANRIRRAEQLLPHPTVGRTAEILAALELLAIADHTHGEEPLEVGARPPGTVHAAH